jgi:uncharacterized protein
MTVWVDGDACPRPVREIVARRCRREGVATVFVADRDVSLPEYPGVEMRVVLSGPEATDEEISRGVEAGDLVITRDILLAEALVGRDVVVLNDRGECFDPGSVAERRSLRDFSYGLRRNGLSAPGPRRYGRKEVGRFANSFDRELVKRLKEK